MREDVVGMTDNHKERRDEGIIAEYNQCWEDFRHRTNVEMTILGIYFAAFAGFVYAYSQTPDATLRVLLGTGGILVSLVVVSLILGERRAWAADIERLQELERLLSGEGGREVVVRAREFDRLFPQRGYSISLSSSFAWYLVLLTLGSGAFGTMTGLGVADWFFAQDLPFGVGGFFVAGLGTALLLNELIRRSLKASRERSSGQSQRPQDK